MDFSAFPKIARLSRNCTVTEKLDGTNASILIQELDEDSPGKFEVLDGIPYLLRAGSRSRWITPEEDNFGFARWVYDRADELVHLGPGHHFGEWWGQGINRGYGLSERRFSLFNTPRWHDPKITGSGECLPLEGGKWCPPCCHVVPVLYEGEFSGVNWIDMVLALQATGSRAALGFMDPEGIVIYHHAANIMFKKTIKGDEEGKHAETRPKKVKPPKPAHEPQIMWAGGRRISGVPYPLGAERRIPR